VSFETNLAFDLPKCMTRLVVENRRVLGIDSEVDTRLLEVLGERRGVLGWIPNDELGFLAVDLSRARELVRLVLHDDLARDVSGFERRGELVEGEFDRLGRLIEHHLECHHHKKDDCEVHENGSRGAVHGAPHCSWGGSVQQSAAGQWSHGTPNTCQSFRLATVTLIRRSQQCRGGSGTSRRSRGHTRQRIRSECGNPRTSPQGEGARSRL